MTTPVKYYIAQYITDVFRQEPRNVGVFAVRDSLVAARFFGEAPGGVLDGRKLRAFPRPEAYRQWAEYWRSLASRPATDIEAALMRSNSANYRVITGGEVTDTGADLLGEVVNYLYSVLVSEGGLIEAMGTLEASDETGGGRLKQQLVEEFAAANIFAKGASELALVPHPVREKVPILGTGEEPHVPAFTQRNGLLYLIETVDFGLLQKERAKQHAGLASYMFEDIRKAEPHARTIAVVRAREEDKEHPSVRYGLSILRSESHNLVNWFDAKARSEFLAERQQVAMSHHH